MPLSTKHNHLKVKVRFTLEQATRAPEGVDVQLYSFLNLGGRWGGWSTPRPDHFTHGKETRYVLYRWLRGPQGRTGLVGKISPPPGFDPRTVQPVASLYTDRAIPATQSCNRNQLDITNPLIIQSR